jgi:hypothetical protein
MEEMDAAAPIPTGLTSDNPHPDTSISANPASAPASDPSLASSTSMSLDGSELQQTTPNPLPTSSTTSHTVTTQDSNPSKLISDSNGLPPKPSVNILHSNPTVSQNLIHPLPVSPIVKPGSDSLLPQPQPHSHNSPPPHISSSISLADANLMRLKERVFSENSDSHWDVGAWNAYLAEATQSRSSSTESGREAFEAIIKQFPTNVRSSFFNFAYSLFLYQRLPIPNNYFMYKSLYQTAEILAILYRL